MRCSNSLWQLGLRNLVILKRYVYLFRASTVHPVLTMAIKSTGTPSGKATMQIGKAGVGRRVGWGVKIERKRLVSSWFSNLHNITFPLQNCQLERGRSVYRVLCKHSLLWNRAVPVAQDSRWAHWCSQHCVQCPAPQANVSPAATLWRQFFFSSYIYMFSIIITNGYTFFAGIFQDFRSFCFT